jgi:hypothetical protein
MRQCRTESKEENAIPRTVDRLTVFLMRYDRRSVGRQGPSKLANKGRGLIGTIWYVILWTNSIPMVLANEHI